MAARNPIYNQLTPFLQKATIRPSAFLHRATSPWDSLAGRARIWTRCQWQFPKKRAFPWEWLCCITDEIGLEISCVTLFPRRIISHWTFKRLPFSDSSFGGALEPESSISYIWREAFRERRVVGLGLAWYAFQWEYLIGPGAGPIRVHIVGIGMTNKSTHQIGINMTWLWVVGVTWQLEPCRNT